IMMSKKLYSMFALFGLFLTLAVSSAQAKPGGLIKINVPFDFQVNGKTLPAGEYAVKRLSENVLLIRSADGNAQAIAPVSGRVQTNAKEAEERLVFHQYGGQYFL